MAEKINIENLSPKEKEDLIAEINRSKSPEILSTPETGTQAFVKKEPEEKEAVEGAVSAETKQTLNVEAPASNTAAVGDDSTLEQLFEEYEVGGKDIMKNGKIDPDAAEKLSRLLGKLHE